MISTSLSLLALVFYLTTTVAWGARSFLLPTKGKTQAGPLERFARPMLWLGIGLQCAAIGFWCVTTKQSPFAGTYGTLCTTSWIIAIVVALCDLKPHLHPVNAVSLLVACLVLFLGFFCDFLLIFSWFCRKFVFLFSIANF